MRTRTLLVALALAVSIPAQADEVLVLHKGKDRRARDLLYHELHSIRVDVTLDEATPQMLAEYLTVASGNIVNFVVVSREDFEPLTLRLKRARLTTVMDIAARFGDLGFTYRNGLVAIQRASEVTEYTSLRRYDVRASTTPIPSFPGPELKLTAPGDDDASVGDGDEEGSPVSGFTADRLVDLIRTQVLPESWDGDDVDVSEHRGVLFVRQTDRGHRKVEELLVAMGVIARPTVIVQKSRGAELPGSSSSATRRAP